jgi:hypothetical protein
LYVINTKFVKSPDASRKNTTLKIRFTKSQDASPRRVNLYIVEFATGSIISFLILIS